MNRHRREQPAQAQRVGRHRVVLQPHQERDAGRRVHRHQVRSLEREFRQGNGLCDRRHTFLLIVQSSDRREIHGNLRRPFQSATLCVAGGGEFCRLIVFGGHPSPASTSPLQSGSRLVQEKLQRGAARKAVPLTVVRIDPVQRAIRFYPCSRRDSQWIEAVELALHGFRRHGRFPDSAAVSTGRRGLRMTDIRGCHHRQQGAHPGIESASIGHGRIPSMTHNVFNCFSSETLRKQGLQGSPGEYYRSKGI